MAKKFETGIIISGDGKGGVRAIKANREELERFDRQSRQSRSSTESLSNSWSTATRVVGGLTSALGLSAAGFAAMVTRQASAARETAALASSIGVSTGRLQELQYAAKSVGLESDAMGDILKDVSDKIGDAYANGGGEALDVINNLGLSVQDLINLRPDEQLLAISARLNELPRAARINALESLGNDLSRLLPLLENNAAGLKAAADEARDFGYALDEEQNKALVDAGNGLTRLTGFAEGFANRMTIAVAPAITETTNNLGELNDLVSDPGFQQALNDVASIGAKMAQGLAKGSLQLVREVGTIDDKLRVWASDQFGIGDDFSVDMSRTNALRTEIDYLQTLANGNWFDRISNGYASVEAVNEKLAEKQAELAAVNGRVFDSFGSLVSGIGVANGAAKAHADATDEDAAATDRLTSALKPLLTTYDADHAKRQQLIADRKTLTDALDKEPEKAEAIRRSIANIDDQLKKLNGTQSTTKSEAQKLSDQLKSRYESTAQSLAQQIALMGKTSNLARINYEVESGALKDLDPDQKKLLRNRAKEVDLLQQRQDLLDNYVNSASLSDLFDARNQAQQIGGATGRIAERNVGKAITDQAREGAPQMQGLDAQYSGAFGEANRIEQERAQLQAWYAERIAMYEDFKSAEADKADEYGAVIADLERQRATQLQQIDMQTQQARLAGWSSMFGDLAGLTSAFAGEQSGLYRTLFATQKAFAVAQALMNVPSSYSKAYDAMIGIPYVGPVLAPAAGAAAAAAQVAQAAAVQGITLSGQAHDGIDSIPADGTWNLQKNERVVDRRTNADLKQYLDRANARSETNAAGTSSGSEARTVVTNTFHIQGQVDEATLQRIEQAEENAYRRVFQDAKTNGPIRRQLRV
ncbi:hypothetical protein [Salinicola acroporae]|uniref:Bacteriophage tail tape measure C-terminal domain-containing protein n=1 Tax=Salinicola acroporae TaxID=1541440 RepID=A0ABT6I4Y7_9GAMM|nr:hypothetical protein [Salinicola acroporae]MDH4572474.1 hypothetical protein [Salinicola acroporae]